MANSTVGVILAGGLGSRLSPATRATCKQILPVYNKPMIYYPLVTLMQAGISEIMIISTVKDIRRFEALFGNGSDLGIQMSYAVQAKPKGIADAFHVAEGYIANRNTALILGDNLFFGSDLESNLNLKSFKRKGATVFGLSVSNPSRYGVAEFDKEGKICKIIEKPKSPPSSYAITGLYFYDNQAMDFVKKLKPSKRGELEITDLNNMYLDEGLLNFVQLKNDTAWFDSGTHDSLLQASAYVQTIEKNHNTIIGSPEKTAFEKGWIGPKELAKLADMLKEGPYFDHLRSLID